MSELAGDLSRQWSYFDAVEGVESNEVPRFRRGRRLDRTGKVARALLLPVEIGVTYLL